VHAFDDTNSLQQCTQRDARRTRETHCSDSAHCCRHTHRGLFEKTQTQNELAERIERESGLLAGVGVISQTQGVREACALMRDFLAELARAVRKSCAQTSEGFYEKYEPERAAQKTVDERSVTSKLTDGGTDRSRAKTQQKWMFANKPEMAQEWAAHTPDIKALPERVKKPADKTASLIISNQTQSPQVPLIQPSASSDQKCAQYTTVSGKTPNPSLTLTWAEKVASLCALESAGTPQKRNRGGQVVVLGALDSQKEDELAHVKLAQAVAKFEAAYTTGTKRADQTARAC
jgi:hypothetical protein